ncbi:MAG: ABC transporter ATP-binding protein [Thermodesulfobacteriota bacterium]
MSRQPLPILFEGVSKSFGPIKALRPTDLDIKAGEFITLLGPSGSGKTTLLNIAAGYLFPDSGRVLIGGRDITATPPRKRNVGMVFQNYALFPHLSVFENVAYGLRVRRVQETEVRRRVEEALGMIQLEGFGPRAIQQLSGGQQQRVALARALVFEPDVLLMDEPLGALDRQLRKHVQLEIRRLHQKIQRTTIYVTHDQEEALVMSDRIGIMKAGRIEQVGGPRELYDRPINDFVASFLGESNLLRGRLVEKSGARGRLAMESLDYIVEGIVGDGVRAGEEAVAMVRPEAVLVSAAAEVGLRARIEEVVYLGELVSLRLCLPNGQEIWCRRIANEGWPSEEVVRVVWKEKDVRILPLSGENTLELEKEEEP